MPPKKQIRARGSKSKITSRDRQSSSSISSSNAPPFSRLGGVQFGTLDSCSCLLTGSEPPWIRSRILDCGGQPTSSTSQRGIRWVLLLRYNGEAYSASVRWTQAGQDYLNQRLGHQDARETWRGSTRKSKRRTFRCMTLTFLSVTFTLTAQISVISMKNL